MLSKYNRWTILEEGFRIGNKKAVKCACDCGTVKIVNKHSVIYGTSKSCGCYLSEVAKKMKTTHGKEGTRIYRVWRHMMHRCSNKNNVYYKDYGGRGIKVCKKWETFQNFYNDMGDVPFEGAEIDRIDNNNGYSKENCRWVTKKQNCRNRRSSRYLTMNGEKRTIAEWSEVTGLSSSLISMRLRLGWSIDATLTKPAGPGPKGRFGIPFAR